MDRWSRRDLLVAAAGSVTVALAGCSDDGPAPGLHAVNAVVHHQPGTQWYDYPVDVGVRVTVENTAARGRQGVLAVTLTRVGADGEWTREREVELSGATSGQYRFTFTDVAASGSDEFEASASIRTSDPAKGHRAP